MVFSQVVSGSAAGAELVQLPRFQDFHTAHPHRGKNRSVIRLASSNRNQITWRWQQRCLGQRRIEERGRRRGAVGPQCKAPSIGEKEFHEVVINSDLPVLVDFWAGWCGPCKLVAPLMDWAEKEYHGKLKVVKIETDHNQHLVEAYKVYGLPTLLLFQGGEVVPGSRREGAISKAKLKNFLSEILPALAAT